MASLATIGLIVSVAGTVASTVSSIRQQQSQAAFAEAEAEFREQEAASVREAAEFEETQFRKRAARVVAKQRAIGAAAGFDISSGSPLLMELESTREEEIEAQNIRRTGRVSAAGKLFQAKMSKFEARLSRGAIPGIAIGGAAKAGRTILDFYIKKQQRDKGKTK